MTKGNLELMKSMQRKKIWFGHFFINVVVKITVPYRCNSRSPPSLDDSLSKRRICDQPWHLWFELAREKYVRILILRIVYGSSQHAHEKSFSEIKSLWSHNGVCSRQIEVTYGANACNQSNTRKSKQHSAIPIVCRGK